MLKKKKIAIRFSTKTMCDKIYTFVIIFFSFNLGCLRCLTTMPDDKGGLISEGYFYFGLILKKVCEITPQLFQFRLKSQR